MNAREPEISVQDRLDIPFLPAFSARRPIFLVYDSGCRFSRIYLPWLPLRGRRDWTTLRYDFHVLAVGGALTGISGIGYDEVRELVHGSIRDING